MAFKTIDRVSKGWGMRETLLIVEAVAQSKPRGVRRFDYPMGSLLLVLSAIDHADVKYSARFGPRCDGPQRSSRLPHP